MKILNQHQTFQELGAKDEFSYSDEALVTSEEVLKREAFRNLSWEFTYRIGRH